MAATNNTFELFDVGLYLDADSVGVPPKWELPAYDDELERCQRYYQYSAGVIAVHGLQLAGAALINDWLLFRLQSAEPPQLLPRSISYTNNGSGVNAVVLSCGHVQQLSVALRSCSSGAWW